MSKKIERRGRPRKPDAGNYENVATSLHHDVMAYVREKMVREQRTLSSTLAMLVQGGIAAEIAERSRIGKRK